MRHKGNHNNSEDQRPEHTTHQYGREDLPQPQKQKGPSYLSRFREKFREKPATAEEIRQLKLNTQREEYKTRLRRAKQARPSRFGGLTGGGERQPSYRRSSRYRQQSDSGLFGGGGGSNFGGSFLDFGSGPSLSFLTGEGQRPRRSKNQKSGLEELF